MTMVRQEFWQLMAPGARKSFVEWRDLKMRESAFRSWMNVESSDKAYEDAIHFAGLPPSFLKPENTPIAYYDLIQGGTKRYVNLTYGIGARWSLELEQDDLYGVIKTTNKAMARSQEFTKEYTATNVLNLGFTSTTTDDGLSLFNNAHPLLGGTAATNVLPGFSNISSTAGTYPNAPATAIDLSFTALQQMVNIFERMPDAQGIPINVKPEILAIPPELQFIAIELLGSAGKPYTGDNEVNSLLGQGLKYMILNYLTSGSAWFALAPKDEHRIRMFERMTEDYDMDDDFDTKAIKVSSIERYSVGADNWIGVYGANGA